MKRYSEIIVNNPIKLIFLILSVTILLGLRLPDLRFHTSIYDLTIEDLPETMLYSEIKKEFGTEEIILVVARTDGVYEPEVFQRLTELERRLAGIPGVQRVIGLPGIKRDIDVTDRMDLAEFQKALAPVDLLLKTVVSADGKTAVLTLILEDTRNKDALVDRVREIIGHERAYGFLYQIGLPVVAQALARYTQKDFLTLPIVSFGVIMLVLLLLFQNIRGTLIPAFSLVIAAIWTFGFMALTNTPLSMLTMIVPIFLIAVGTAYCMHMLADYNSRAATASSPKEAVKTTLEYISFPTSLAVTTTIIGLLSLLVNKITAIREFAVFSGVGILSMLIILMVFVPAVLVLMPLPRAKREKDESFPDWIGRSLEWIIKVHLVNQRESLTILGLITMFAAAGILLIKVENNPVGYFKENTPISQNFHDVYQDMSGSIPINVVLISGKEKYFRDPDHLQLLEHIQQELAGFPGVDKSESYADYLKLVNYATNRYDPEYYRLPEERFEVRMLTNSFTSLLGNDLLLRFTNQDYSKANIILRTHISRSSECLRAQQEILTKIRGIIPPDLKVEVSGFGMVMAHSAHLLTQGQVRSLSITLLLVFIVMFLLFLSFKVGVIAMVPNIFPIIINFGLMGWLGMELSAATSLIASVAIGLAVDDTIHYMFRFNREFKKDLDRERALRTTITKVGRPIIFTTLTVSLGFAVLMFSSFKPTTAFGLMMVVTMISALVADLFLLPTLMMHVELVTLWDLIRLKLGRDPEQGIRLFNGLNRSQVHLVLLAGTLKQLEEGEILFSKGETSDTMYTILSGSVEVVDIADIPECNHTRERHVIIQLKPGDVVGEMGMVRHCRRSATVIARTQTELLVVNERMIKRLTWLFPPTAYKFFFNLMSIMCDRLEYTTSALARTTTVELSTGLFYRNFFLKELGKELKRAKRYHYPVSLVLAEFDPTDMEAYPLPQEKREQILSAVSKLMLSEVRASDQMCHWGRLQIAFLLVDTTHQSAILACGRLAESIREHSLSDSQELKGLRMVFGVTSWDPADDLSVDDMVTRATDALMQAQTADMRFCIIPSPAKT